MLKLESGHDKIKPDRMSLQCKQYNFPL